MGNAWQVGIVRSVGGCRCLAACPRKLDLPVTAIKRRERGVAIALLKSRNSKMKKKERKESHQGLETEREEAWTTLKKLGLEIGPSVSTLPQSGQGLQSGSCATP